MGRVCVFVDGENFRYSICDLFHDTFERNGYLPKLAKWEELFNWIVKEVSSDAERLRTYWYVTDLIDFFPYDLPTTEKDRERLLKTLNMDVNIRNELNSTQGEDLKNVVLRKHRKILKDRESAMQSRFQGWRNIQDAIATKHDAIEFRRAGAIKYNLFQEKLGSEKAVDVKLATDMIALEEIYDIAVIVSGDQDYVPAVQYVKDRGKRVVNVSFLTKGGKLLPGGARRLNQITDSVLQIEHHKMKDFLNL